MSLSTNRQFGNCGLINCGNSFVSFEKVLLEQLFRGWQTFQILSFAAIRTMTSTILVQSFSRAYVASLTGTILHFFSSFWGSNIGNSCICHFIFIFHGYKTNKLNDQLPVTWLTDANWLEPCLGIAVRVNPGKPPIFSGFFFSQLHKLRL